MKLDKLAIQSFLPLKERFNLDFKMADGYEFGDILEFYNSHIVIKIVIDYRDNDINCYLAPISNGKIPEFPASFNSSNIFNHYNLKDIVRIFNPEKMMIFNNIKALFEGAPTINVFNQFEETLLSEYSDVLNGNFDKLKEANRYLNEKK